MDNLDKKQKWCNEATFRQVFMFKDGMWHLIDLHRGGMQLHGDRDLFAHMTMSWKCCISKHIKLLKMFIITFTLLNFEKKMHYCLP